MSTERTTPARAAKIKAGLAAAEEQAWEDG